MWQPYFVSAGWDPFANGTWAWYSGAGYSWVSPYPWGWTPFHSGSWISCPGAGWGWQPGSSWNGLNNAPALMTMNRQLPNLPQAPGRPPSPGQSTLVRVNLKPLTPSDFGSSRQNFVFQKDSAGLGIPRGSFGKLDRISDQVVHHGTLNAPVYLGPPSTAQGGGRPVSGGAFSASRPSYEEPSTPERPSSTSSGSIMGTHSTTAPVSAPTTGTATGRPN